MRDPGEIDLLHISYLQDQVMAIDPDRLTDVASNLISNAIKFTPAEGSVTVETLYHKQQLILKVADTGPGITEEALPYIFDRFYQADSSDTRKAEGTGIGLALTREIVYLMGGNIVVDSEVEREQIYRPSPC